jgi:4'-phosphopantetheinyl transferase
VGPSERMKIWALKLDSVDPDLRLLSKSERQRASRLKGPQDGARLLRAHYALRRLIALELGHDPACLEFGQTDAGKPFLSSPSRGLEFNLSHSGGYGLIAVSKDRRVGVDIEVQRALSDVLAVALQIASPDEARALEQIAMQELHSVFFTLWTRKEALLKAVGRGFLTDPREVEVGIGTSRAYVNLDDRVWTVESLAVNSDVVAAMVIEGKLDAPLIAYSI